MKNNFNKALAALTIPLLLAGCGESANTDGNSVVQKAEAAPLSLGSTGKANGLDFTLTKVEQLAQIGREGGPTAGPTEVYVVARFNFKNTSTKTLGMFDQPAVTLVDGQGQTYAKDDVASITVALMGEGNAGTDDLNPGVSGQSAIAWKVDKKAFDRSKWRIVVATDPVITFALNSAPSPSKQ